MTEEEKEEVVNNLRELSEKASKLLYYHGRIFTEKEVIAMSDAINLFNTLTFLKKATL